MSSDVMYNYAMSSTEWRERLYRRILSVEMAKEHPDEAILRRVRIMLNGLGVKNETAR